MPSVELLPSPPLELIDHLFNSEPIKFSNHLNSYLVNHVHSRSNAKEATTIAGLLDGWLAACQLRLGNKITIERYANPKLPYDHIGYHILKDNKRVFMEMALTWVEKKETSQEFFKPDRNQNQKKSSAIKPKDTWNKQLERFRSPARVYFESTTLSQSTSQAALASSATLSEQQVLAYQALKSARNNFKQQIQENVDIETLFVGLAYDSNNSEKQPLLMTYSKKLITEDSSLPIDDLPIDKKLFSDRLKNRFNNEQAPLNPATNIKELFSINETQGQNNEYKNKIKNLTLKLFQHINSAYQIIKPIWASNDLSRKRDENLYECFTSGFFLETIRETRLYLRTQVQSRRGRLDLMAFSRDLNNEIAIIYEIKYAHTDNKLASQINSATEQIKNGEYGNDFSRYKNLKRTVALPLVFGRDGIAIEEFNHLTKIIAINEIPQREKGLFNDLSDFFNQHENANSQAFQVFEHNFNLEYKNCLSFYLKNKKNIGTFSNFIAGLVLSGYNKKNIKNLFFSPENQYKKFHFLIEPHNSKAPLTILSASILSNEEENTSILLNEEKKLIAYYKDKLNLLRPNENSIRRLNQLTICSLVKSEELQFKHREISWPINSDASVSAQNNGPVQFEMIFEDDPKGIVDKLFSSGKRKNRYQTQRNPFHELSPIPRERNIYHSSEESLSTYFSNFAIALDQLLPENREKNLEAYRHAAMIGLLVDNQETASIDFIESDLSGGPHGRRPDIRLGKTMHPEGKQEKIKSCIIELKVQNDIDPKVTENALLQNDRYRSDLPQYHVRSVQTVALTFYKNSELQKKALIKFYSKPRTVPDSDHSEHETQTDDESLIRSNSQEFSIEDQEVENSREFSMEEPEAANDAPESSNPQTPNQKRLLSDRKLDYLPKTNANGKITRLEDQAEPLAQSSNDIHESNDFGQNLCSGFSPRQTRETRVICLDLENNEEIETEQLPKEELTKMRATLNRARVKALFSKSASRANLLYGLFTSSLGLFQGNVKSTFLGIGGLALSQFGSKISGRMEKFALKTSSRGLKIALGRGAPVVNQLIGSPLIIKDWIESIQKVNNGDQEAIVDVGADSVFLTLAAIEAFGVETGPVGDVVSVVIMMGTSIYHAAHRVNEIDKFYHLTKLEKLEIGWQLFLGRSIDSNIESNIERKKVNNNHLNNALAKLGNLKNTHDIIIITQGGRKKIDQEIADGVNFRRNTMTCKSRQEASIEYYDSSKDQVCINLNKQSLTPSSPARTSPDIPPAIKPLCLPADDYKLDGGQWQRIAPYPRISSHCLRSETVIQEKVYIYTGRNLRHTHSACERGRYLCRNAYILQFENSTAKRALIELGTNDDYGYFNVDRYLDITVESGHKNYTSESYQTNHSTGETGYPGDRFFLKGDEITGCLTATKSSSYNQLDLSDLAPDSATLQVNNPDFNSSKIIYGNHQEINIKNFHIIKGRKNKNDTLYASQNFSAIYLQSNGTVVGEGNQTFFVNSNEKISAKFGKNTFYIQPGSNNSEITLSDYSKEELINLPYQYHQLSNSSYHIEEKELRLVHYYMTDDHQQIRQYLHIKNFEINQRKAIFHYENNAILRPLHSLHTHPQIALMEFTQYINESVSLLDLIQRARLVTSMSSIFYFSVNMRTPDKQVQIGHDDNDIFNTHQEDDEYYMEGQEESDVYKILHYAQIEINNFSKDKKEDFIDFSDLASNKLRLPFQRDPTDENNLIIRYGHGRIILKNYCKHRNYQHLSIIHGKEKKHYDIRFINAYGAIGEPCEAGYRPFFKYNPLGNQIIIHTNHLILKPSDNFHFFNSITFSQLEDHKALQYCQNKDDLIMHANHPHSNVGFTAQWEDYYSKNWNDHNLYLASKDGEFLYPQKRKEDIKNIEPCHLPNIQKIVTYKFNPTYPLTIIHHNQLKNEAGIYQTLPNNEQRLGLIDLGKFSCFSITTKNNHLQLVNAQNNSIVIRDWVNPANRVDFLKANESFFYIPELLSEGMENNRLCPTQSSTEEQAEEDNRIKRQVEAEPVPMSSGANRQHTPFDYFADLIAFFRTHMKLTPELYARTPDLNFENTEISTPAPSELFDTSYLNQIFNHAPAALSWIIPTIKYFMPKDKSKINTIDKRKELEIKLKNVYNKCLSLNTEDKLYYLQRGYLFDLQEINQDFKLLCEEYTQGLVDNETLHTEFTCHLNNLDRYDQELSQFFRDDQDNVTSIHRANKNQPTTFIGPNSFSIFQHITDKNRNSDNSLCQNKTIHAIN